MKSVFKIVSLSMLISMISGCNHTDRRHSDTTVFTDSSQTIIKSGSLTGDGFNEGFEKADNRTGLPEGWLTGSPRREIEPAFSLDSSVSHSGKYSAKITSNGSSGTLGYWRYILKGLQAEDQIRPFKMSRYPARDSAFLGNTSYVIRCFFKTKDITDPGKNIWVRAIWLDSREEVSFTELISNYVKEGEWFKIEDVITAPTDAMSLELQLTLQWTSTGTVWWDDLSITGKSLPAKRLIKIASACSTPPKPSTPDKNRDFYADMASRAAKAGADIICLGEAITVVSTDIKAVDVAEPVPGPTTRILGQAARKSNLYIIAGIYEKEADIIYNTAVLLDRKGNIAGKYRKTHLPETEACKGVTPGTTYPVFQTDFGKVGIEICYDNFFPEVARSLAVNGAEIIFLPIWGDIREGGNTWDIVARTRAIDNSCYFVASMYDNKRSSLIISPYGKILADGRNGGEFIVADIDLGLRTFEPWLSTGKNGEFKKLYPKERRPETYGDLTKSQ